VKKALFVLILAVSLMAMGCQTFWLPGVGSAQVPGGLSEVNANVSKVGESKETVILGLFGDTNGWSATQVAQANGITKIAAVDYGIKPGFLNLWQEYYIRVAGE
jgi:hypothetical protein